MPRFKNSLCLMMMSMMLIMLAAPLAMNTVTAQDEDEPLLEHCLIDLIIALDESPSIGPSFADADDEFPFVLGFAAGLIEGLPVNEDNVHVGVVLYDVTPDTLLPLTGDAEAALETVEGYDRGETTGTAMAQGIDLAMRELEAGRPAVQDVIVLLADGDDNQIGEPETSSADAREKNAQIFAVAVGDDLNLDQLRTVANDPDEDYFFQAEDFDDLPGLIDSINRNACGVPSTLSGVAFFDDEGDASLGEDEAGVEGVTLRLYHADDLTTAAVPDQVTDADGAYTFQVAPGEYVIEVVDAPQPLVEGSDFDADTLQTELITVEVNASVDALDVPLVPLPEPTATPTATRTATATRTPMPTVTATPQATATPEPPQGPRYIQFNHPGDIVVTIYDQPQLSVQFGNIGQETLTDLQVVCTVVEGNARFTEVIFNDNFSSVNESPAKITFSGLDELPAGQNYTLIIAIDPKAGTSDVQCDLMAEDFSGATDVQRITLTN